MAYVIANIFLQEGLADVEHWGFCLGLGTCILLLRGCSQRGNRNYWDWCMGHKF